MTPGWSMAPTMDADILVGNSVAIGHGDPMKWASGGMVAYTTTATDIFSGVFESCKYADANGIEQWDSYLPISTAALATVYWHPSQLYRVQGGNTALTQAHRGQNADLIAHASPSATTKLSAAYLDTAGTLATTNTLGWHILDWERTPADGQTIGETYPILLVMCNRSFYANQVAGY